MKKINLYITVLLSLCLSVSSWAQIADKTEGCIPLTVNFDGIDNLGSYSWNFGDGTSSIEELPSHTYTSAGVFNVILRDGPAGPIRGEVTITVYADPVISVIASDNVGCAPFGITFTSDVDIDPGLTITEYFWTFGDGNTSMDANPTHTYTNAGVFDISLRVRTNITECDKVEIFSNLITIDGVASNFTFTASDLCSVPTTITFVNTSIISPNTTYEWDFGNGMTSDQQVPMPVTYTVAGSYPVTLKTISANGCESINTQNVQVGVQELNVDVPDTVCLNTPVTFTNNTGALSNVWFIGNIGFPSFSPLASPTFTFLNPGLQNVRYTATFGSNCTGDTTYQIFVEDPSAEFIVNNPLDCADPMIVDVSAIEKGYAQYIWNDSITTEPDFPFTYQVERDSLYLNQRDTSFITLDVVSSAGCIGTFTNIFIQRKPNAELTPSVSRGCAPLDVTFADISTAYDDIVYYKWLYGTGDEEENNGDDVTYTYTSPGEYHARLIIETENGCRDTSNRITIYVGEQITPVLDVNEEICINESISFNTTTLDSRIDSWHFYTDSGRIGDCWTDPMASHQFMSDPGVYDVTLTVEYNGCASTQTSTGAVTVNGAKARIGYEIECDDPNTVNVTSNGRNANSVRWIFDEFGESTDPNTSFTFDETGDYTITLIAEDPSSGCAPDTATQEIHIRNIRAVFDVPDRVCDNEEITINASDSEDVYESCFTGYFWEFRDHRPRETANDEIKHVFTLRGENSLRLTVTDINGCKHTLSDTLMVYGIDPEFTVDKTRLCLPAEITVDNLTTSDTTIVSWRWNFGSNFEEPGTVPLTNQNFQTIIELSVEDALGCEDSYQVAIEEYQVFSDIIIDPGNNGCVGDTVFFRATDFTEEGSFLNYDWDFGSLGGSMDRNPFVVFDQSGNFPITMTYEEDQSGCGDEINLSVNIVDTPIADFSTPFDNDEVICFGSQIEFTNQSTADPSATFLWTFSDGTPATNVENPVLGFQSGTVDVTLTTTSAFGCSDEITKTYTLIGPTGELTLDKNSICFGEEIQFSVSNLVDVNSYSIDFGDGEIAENIDNITHTYDNELDSNRTIVSLVLKSQDTGCETIVLDTIEIVNPDIRFGIEGDLGIEKSYCPGDPIKLINLSSGISLVEGQDEWSWSGEVNSNLANLINTIEFDEKGEFIINLEGTVTPSGCAGTYTDTIRVNGPDVIAVADASCLGDPTSITISNYNPDWDYTYTLNGVKDTIRDSQFELMLGSSNPIIIEVTDPLSCSSTNSIDPNLFIPLSGVEWDTVVYTDNKVTLPLINYNMGFESELVGNTTEVEYDEDGNPFYIASDLTDTVFTFNIMYPGNVCPNDVLTFRVLTLGCDLIPTIFSPNGDDLNDNFNIVTRQNARSAFEIVQFRVFDRWGTTVYNNENNGVGWNGLDQSNKKTPSDVYSWYMEIRGANGGASQICKGNVTLIR